MAELKRFESVAPPAYSSVPVSAATACSWPSPSAPTTQKMASAPPPVVVAMGEPRVEIPAHHAVRAEIEDPASMRSASRPRPPGQLTSRLDQARKVPPGVLTAA